MAYTTIDDPSAYFQTLLYTGNATGSRALTNDGNSDLQPDWLWIKQRNSAKNHNIWDSSRGVTKQLRANLTNAEATNTTDDQIVSLNSDGFTLGDDTDSVGVNENTNTYVAWQWKANGGTTASNTDGTITSTVQANTTAGFSIISYTGNGTNGATIGHGLNETPQIFFPKCLSTTTNWEMYYFPTGGTRQFGYLNLGNAFGTWSFNAPSSTIISLSGSTDSNGSGRTMIGYAFHSVQGYSKIGTYTGNGSADGTFVYLGFRPAWVMYKCTSHATDGWYIQDSTISPYNVTDGGFRVNSTDAEAAGLNIGDMLSNGFKIRIGANNNFNASGRTYLYMAFAESPFVLSKGVPTTAR